MKLFFATRALPAAVTALVGAVVLADWLCGIGAFKEISLGGVLMAPSTALSFMLAGLALWMHVAREPADAAPSHALPLRPVRRRVAQGLAGVVLLVGLITGTGHLVGRNLDLGQLIFSAVAMTGGAGPPNSMAPLTAFNFVLAGGALLALLGAPGQWRGRALLAVRVAAGLVVAIAVTILLGYAGGLRAGGNVWGYTAGMAVLTAGLFVVLGAGLLLAAGREAPLVWAIGKRITATFAAGLLVLFVEIALVFKSTAGLESTTREVAHSNEVRFRVSELLSILQQVEAMQRGFLLTGQEEFLVPYLPAGRTAVSQMATLRRLTANHPAHQRRLAALGPLISARLDFAAKTIEVFRRQGEEAAKGLVQTGRGKTLMVEISRLLVEMDDEEEILVRHRKAELEATIGRAQVFLPLGALASVTLFALVFLALNRAILRRHRAEQHLRLQGIALDAAAHAIIITDRAGVIESVNAAFTKLSGYDAAEAIGRNPRELVKSGRHEAEFYRSMWNTILAGRVWRGELINRRKDGSLYPEEMTITPVGDNDGGITHFIAIALDITARQQAEAALRASEADFRLLAEAMPQIVWATRPDGWNIFFNHQWVDYTGLTLEESYGPGWNKPFHPDDQQRAWDAWQNATTNLATYSLECRLRRADGEYRWWLIRGVPMRNEDGKILKWFGTCTDIHEMKLAAEQLRQSEEFNRRLIASSSDCIKVLDPEATLLSMNENGRRLLEIRDLNRYLNKCWISFWQPEDQPRVREAVAVARAGGVGRLQAFCPSEAGSPRWWDVIITPIREADGRVRQLLAVSRDITAHKQAEEALARRAEELAQFNAAAVGRELRMIELKAEINDLARQLGRPPPYEMESLAGVVPSTPSAAAPNVAPTSP